MKIACQAVSFSVIVSWSCCIEFFQSASTFCVTVCDSSDPSISRFVVPFDMDIFSACILAEGGVWREGEGWNLGSDALRRPVMPWHCNLSSVVYR